MPAFCLARPPGQAGDLLLNDLALWQGLMTLCRTPAPQSVQALPGSYLVSADRNWQPHLLGPAAMRSLAARLSEDARAKGRVLPAPVEQLMRRLGG